MKETIFDLIQDDIPEGKEGYFAIAEKAPEPKDNSFLNSVKDYAKTFLKGSIEGISRLGTIMGPLPHEGKNSQQELEEQTETLDKYFPTDEGYIQKGSRRGLREAPIALAFPGSSISVLPRAIAAGFLGEGAKDLDLPEWAQTAAELTAYIGPDITKKLLEKGSNSELIKEARKLGISDEALTPLLQSDFKQKWLSRLTPRRGETQTILEKSKSEIDAARSALNETQGATNFLKDEDSIKLIDTLENVLKDIPSSVRKKINEDFLELVKSNPSGKNLMNFWSDINHQFGESTKQLSLLKKPIKEAIEKISPELAKDFETVNLLYTKYFPIAKKLAPNLQTDIMGAAKSLGLLGGIVTGNYHLLAQFATPAILGKLSQQLLLNPRYQQLSQKIVNAINQNKFSLAKKTIDLVAHEVRKLYPEGAEQIENISEEDLMNLFKIHQNKTSK